MPVRAHDAGEYLRTPADVAAYLNAAMEESDGDRRLLMKAFGNVVRRRTASPRSQGEQTSIAKLSLAACRETGILGWERLHGLQPRAV